MCFIFMYAGWDHFFLLNIVPTPTFITCPHRFAVKNRIVIMDVWLLIFLFDTVNMEINYFVLAIGPWPRVVEYADPTNK